MVMKRPPFEFFASSIRQLAVLLEELYNSSNPVQKIGFD
jgi:hypothetical protein